MLQSFITSFNSKLVYSSHEMGLSKQKARTTMTSAASLHQKIIRARIQLPIFSIYVSA